MLDYEDIEIRPVNEIVLWECANNLGKVKLIRVEDRETEKFERHVIRFERPGYSEVVVSHDDSTKAVRHYLKYAEDKIHWGKVR